MGLEKFLLTSLLFFNPSQSSQVSPEDIKKYIGFVKTGNEITYCEKHKLFEPCPVSAETAAHWKLIDYHSTVRGLSILYHKNSKNEILETTFSSDTASNTIAFLENRVIDGIPEQVITYSKELSKKRDPDSWVLIEFKSMKSEDKRKVLRQYHQIINYVLDSLPKKTKPN